MHKPTSSVSRDGARWLAAIHSASFPAGQAWEKEFFEKLLEAPLTRGLWVTNFDEPVAFILWQHGPDAAEIYTIAVMPGARRQGFAKHLLTVAENAMRHDGITRAVLDVATDNPDAQALYATNGYNEIARRKAYYARAGGEKADAIVMEKQLVA